MKGIKTRTKVQGILVVSGVLLLIVMFNMRISAKEDNLIMEENFLDSASASPTTQSYYSAEEYQDLINELESNRDSIISGSSLTAEEFDENIQVMRKVLQEIEAGITVVYKNDERWDENESSYAIGLSRSESRNDVSVVGSFSNMSSTEVNEYLDESVKNGLITENEAVEILGSVSN